jgi:hypothetical protein
MADAAGLAKLFAKATQVTMAVKLDGEHAVVTLRPAEVKTVAHALSAIAKPLDASTKRSD